MTGAQEVVDSWAVRSIHYRRKENTKTPSSVALKSSRGVAPPASRPTPLAKLRQEVDELRRAPDETQKELAYVVAQLKLFKEAISIETVELRQVSPSQLKDEIRSLMADGKVRFEDEIADAWQVDVLDVLRALDDLETGGEIETP
ncbi:MAG: hypothetical protein HY318_12670 [Armatimonadetes bacterium]|nr:hypothetical protein [Armatimonadota bacterium]